MAALPLLTQIFEAYPSPTFLVDGDVVVQLANRAARELAEIPEGESVPQKRGGELLRCVHAGDHEEGCGRSEACQACVVRGSVAAALLSGAVARRQATMELRAANGERFDLHLLVSASPVEVEDTRLAVLTLEDVSEIVRRGNEAPADGARAFSSVDASLVAFGESEPSLGEGEASLGEGEASFEDVGASLPSEV